MYAWQQLGQSIEELCSIELKGPEDAKQVIQAAYILGMIQSDPDKVFPTEVFKFIRECQAWEA